MSHQLLQRPLTVYTLYMRSSGRGKFRYFLYAYDDGSVSEGEWTGLRRYSDLLEMANKSETET